MSSRKRIQVTPEGWYYCLLLAFLFVGAVLRQINLLLLLTGLLAGPMWFGWRWVARSLAGLEARRRLPHGVCAGDLLVVHLDLANTRRRRSSWAVVLEDRIVPLEKEHGRRSICPAVFFTHVPAKTTRRREYRGRLTRRGRYRVGPLKLSTRFPLGLVWGALTFDDVATLTVFPRLGRLTAAWRARHRLAHEGHQPHSQGSTRVSGDFYGVREWQSGDSRRWIHWRSSARHQTLVVRQFEQPRHRDVAVLVDLWAGDPRNDEQIDHVELAVSFAASVVCDVCRRGGGSLLLAVADQPLECVWGAASAPVMERMMDRLATARPRGDLRPAALVEAASPRIKPETEIVLVTTRKIGPEQLQSCHQAEDIDGLRRGRNLRIVSTQEEAFGEYFEPQ